MPPRRPDQPATSALALGTDPPGLGHNHGPALADEVTIDNTLSMTIKNACRATDFSKDAMYDLLKNGEVKSFLLFGRRYILAESLRDYVARKAAEPVSIRRGPNTRRDGPRVEDRNRGGRKSSTVRAD
jgi:hypothetical protein